MKKFNLPAKSKLVTFMFFVVFATIDFIWLMLMCDKISHQVFFIVIGALQFYFAFEFGSSYTDNQVELDFRSQRQKDLEELDRVNNLIEGAKNKLVMDALDGRITEEQALKRLDLILRITEENLALPEPSKEEMV